MTRLLRYVRPEQLRELILVVIILAVALFFATQIPDYLSGRTFTRVSTSVAVVAEHLAVAPPAGGARCR